MVKVIAKTHPPIPEETEETPSRNSDLANDQQLITVTGQSGVLVCSNTPVPGQESEDTNAILTTLE